MVPRAFSGNHLDALVPAVRLIVRDEIVWVGTVKPKADVQGRYAALFIIDEAFYRAPRAVPRCALVIGKLSLAQEIVATHILARDLVIKESTLIHEAMLG